MGSSFRLHNQVAYRQSEDSNPEANFAGEFGVDSDWRRATCRVPPLTVGPFFMRGMLPPRPPGE